MTTTAEKVRQVGSIVSDFITKQIAEGQKLLQLKQEHIAKTIEHLHTEFDRIIKLVENRRERLLSEFIKSSNEITDSIKSDIDKCSTLIEEIDKKCKQVDTKGSHTVHNYAILLKDAETQIKQSFEESRNLFEVENLIVGFNADGIAQIIGTYGNILQPSAELSEYTGEFIDDHYQINLTTRTKDGQLYPCGGLSVKVYYSSDDKNFSSHVLDKKNGTYIITLIPKKIHHNPQIMVELDGQLVNSLQTLGKDISKTPWACELYNRRDHTFDEHVHIKDGFNMVYFKGNHRLNLILLDGSNWQITHEKIMSKICEISPESASLYLYKTFIYVTNPVNNSVQKYRWSNGELVKEYNDKMVKSNVFNHPTNLLVYILKYKSGDQEFIVFVNKNDSKNRLVTIDGEGKIIYTLSDAVIGLKDIYISIVFCSKSGDAAVFESTVCIIGINDRGEQIMKYIKPNGEFIMSKNINHRIYSICSTSKYILIVSEKYLQIYNYFGKTVCRVSIKNQYNILKLESHKLYAIDSAARLITSWDISIE